MLYFCSAFVNPEADEPCAIKGGITKTCSPDTLVRYYTRSHVLCEARFFQIHKSAPVDDVHLYERYLFMFLKEYRCDRTLGNKQRDSKIGYGSEVWPKYQNPKPTGSATDSATGSAKPSRQPEMFMKTTRFTDNDVENLWNLIFPDTEPEVQGEYFVGSMFGDDDIAGLQMNNSIRMIRGYYAVADKVAMLFL